MNIYRKLVIVGRDFTILNGEMIAGWGVNNYESYEG